MEPARKGLLRQKPRDPKEPILNKSLLSRIGAQGLLIAVVPMIAFYLGYQESAALASTCLVYTSQLAGDVLAAEHGAHHRGIIEADPLLSLQHTVHHLSLIHILYPLLRFCQYILNIL